MTTLTGRELDVAIAERLEGWIWVTTSEKAKYRFLVDRWFAERHSYVLNPDPSLEVDRSTVLLYHKNWEDTWRAILIARKMGIHFTIASTVYGSISLNFSLLKQNGLYSHYSRYADEKDAPTVICQLILGALEEMEKKNE